MTIYDIASKAGVSISTVSRVLNNSKRVNPETRKKVQTILEKYNYTPNAMARGLVYKSMSTVGIVTADIRNFHFAHTAYTLENQFFNWGFSAVLCNTGNKSEKKRDYIRILAEKKVDGLIFVGSAFTDIDIEASILKYLPQTPIVVANGTLAVPNVHTVLLDHDLGMELAVRHLAERGHRDIILVRTSQTYNSLQKIKGFHRAMKLQGLETGDACVVQCSYGYQGGLDAVEEILATKKRASALVFCDDSTALSAVNGLIRKGYLVPRDMAVVGYDNSDYSLYANPQLTTVDIKNDIFATIVANTLHDVLRKKPVGSSISLNPDLIIREST